MKVLVIGYGAVGSVLTKLLIQDSRIDSVTCLDVKFFEKIKSKKVEFKLFNVLEKEKLISYLKEKKPDVVVNASLPKFNLLIMGCCAEARVNYLDTASYWGPDPDPKAKVPYKMEQLDYNDEFKKRNLIGLIESGVAPGLDNVLAAECASQLDEVDYIKIRMVEDTGSSDIFFSWNKDWLLDELGTKPIIYENGKWKIVESFGAEEEYEFPAPIGKRKTYYFAQDEVGSLPLYIKAKKVDVKIHDNNIDVSKLLVSLGMVSNIPIKVGNTEVKPIEFLSRILPDHVPGEEKKFPKAVFAISVEAIGRKKGKKKTIKLSVVFPNQKEIGRMGIGANFISYPTALSVKIFTTLIPLINKAGVFPPECLSKEVRKAFFEEFEKSRIKIIKICGN